MRPSSESLLQLDRTSRGDRGFREQTQDCQNPGGQREIRTIDPRTQVILINNEWKSTNNENENLMFH